MISATITACTGAVSTTTGAERSQCRAVRAPEAVPQPAQPARSCRMVGGVFVGGCAAQGRNKNADKESQRCRLRLLVGDEGLKCEGTR